MGSRTLRVYRPLLVTPREREGSFATGPSFGLSGEAAALPTKRLPGGDLRSGLVLRGFHGNLGALLQYFCRQILKFCGKLVCLCGSLHISSEGLLFSVFGATGLAFERALQ